MRLILLLVLVRVVAGCSGAESRAGTEGGTCYGNGTCNAGLTCLSDRCVVAPRRTVTLPTVATPNLPPTTAVILDDFEGAAVLACSKAEKLVGSAWACSQEITGDLAVASLGGGTRRLGKPKTLKCDPTGMGDVREKRAGFSIDKAKADTRSDLVSQFLIWPAARARDAILWNRAPKVDMASLNRRAREVSDGLTYRFDDRNVLYVLEGDVEVRGALTADIDGDDKPDTIYSIALPSENAPFWQPRYLLAAVSSRPGQLLEVGSSTYSELQAVAAIDLDGNGTDEVLVTEPYHEGSSSYVGRFNGAELVSIGGWGCGL